MLLLKNETKQEIN